MRYPTMIEIRDLIASGETTAVEVVKECLKTIKAKDKKIGAFVETYDQEALAKAKKIDAMKAAGEDLPPLAGVPIAIKDNICYKDHLTCAGSKILEKYKASYSATVVERLEAAGAIFVGRTNMDEFAMGSSTETSFFRKTRNPWDTDKVPGGSSGGSAAAVASGMVSAALGSDTGGSVRQPAALCGITGLKPTYGRVSRYGLIAFASSLDQIGVLTRGVEDAALLLQIIEGGDEKDATSVDLDETTLAEAIDPSVKGMKIGVAKEFFDLEFDSEVKKRVEAAIDVLKKAGAEIVKVKLPLAPYALPTYYIISPAEASSNLGRFDGLRYGTRADCDVLKDSYLAARREGFGREVKRRILLGTYILSAGYYEAYYKKAQAVRTAIFDEMQKVFKKVDVLVSPTSPSVAWNIGEKFDDPITMYLSDIFTVTANIVGSPAISIPCGTAHDLPVGLQFMGPAFGDGKVLRIAAAFQKLTDWHHELPSKP